jgi:hypothetical protein
MILLVVLVLLTLFAVVGVAFVTFSETQTTQASQFKANETENRPDPDLLLGYVLNQLVFDTAKADSSLRTHSLVRNMYGGTNNHAFDGVGRLHSAGPIMDNYYLTNFQGQTLTTEAAFELQYGSLSPTYTYPDHNNVFLGAMRNDTAGSGTGFVIARSFARTVQLPVQVIATGALTTVTFDPYAPGNQAFWIDPYWLPPLPPGLAYRPAFLNAFTNPAAGAPMAGWLLKRAMVMRPGPWDHPNFTPPDNPGGDVKNLPPGHRTFVDLAGANAIFADGDSHWIDLGYPVQIDSQGRRYKPMFSFFIQDLDGRVNVNMHGNIRGNGAAFNVHVSNQGWGPWEVSLGNVLPLGDPTAGGRPEWLRLFGGRSIIPGNIQAERGRYGYSNLANNPAQLDPDVVTAPSPLAAPERFWSLLRPAPLYNRYDFDGTLENQIAAQLNPALRFTPSRPFLTPRLVGGGPAAQLQDPANRFLSYDRFPRYSGRTGNMPINPNTWYFGYGSNSFDEVGKPFLGANARPHNHPMYSNPYVSPSIPQLTGLFGISPDRTFKASDMEAILRHGDTGADAQFSSLRRLIPVNLNTPNARRLITTHSTDVNRPGTMPYIRQFNPLLGDTPPGGNYELRLPAGSKYPSGTPIRFPNTSPSLLPAGAGDYRAHWRTTVSDLLKTDLNRFLPNYPALPPVVPATGRQVYDTTNPAVMASFSQAQLARQEMARDIYLRLITVTGSFDPTQQIYPNVPPPTMPLGTTQVNALRYLAQLAVNIVDYLDEDDFVTPFNWGAIGTGAFTGTYGNQWVYGTEMPRVLLNELYVERQPAAVAPPSTPFNLWIELFNPLNDGSVTSNAFLLMPPSTPVAPDAYAVHRIIVARPDAPSALNLRHPANVLGDLPRNANPDLQPSIPSGPAPTNQALANSYYDTMAGAAAVIDFKTPAPPAGNNYRLGDAQDRYRGIPGNPAPGGAIPQGFYVLGPDSAPFPAAGSPNSEPLNYSTPQLNLRRNPPGGSGAFTNNNEVVVMLQRLACPHLPPNPPPDPANPQNFLALDPALPLNPYLTVDYMDLTSLAPGAPGTPRPVNDSAAGFGDKFAVGKRQPFSSYGAALSYQTPDSNPATVPAVEKFTNRPQHTFWQHNSIERALPTSIDPIPGGALPNAFVQVNPETAAAAIRGVPTNASQLPNPTRIDPTYMGVGGNPMPANPAPLPAGAYQTLDLPFDWYVHLDREAINPMELLHVSGFKPHELTQEFIKNAPPSTPQEIALNGPAATITKYGHYAPWFDENSRLFRLFELLECRHRTAGFSIYQLRAAGVAPIAAPAGIPGVPVGTPLLRITLNPVFGTMSGATANKARYNLQVGTCVALWAGTPQEGISRIVNIPGANTFDVLAEFPPPPAANDRNIAVICQGGLHPGKININTAYDLQTWLALVDPQPANEGMTAADVVALHGLHYPPTFRPGYAATDRPYKGMEPGPSPAGQTQLPNGQGMEDTYFRSNPTNPTRRLFERGTVGTDHPYRRLEILSKVFNNITSRSNCFAVWVTVGYFEVGPEGVRTTTPMPAGTPGPLVVGVSSTAGMRVNQYLVLDRGAATQEIVRILAVGNNTITVNRAFTPAGFRFAHAANTPLDAGIMQEIGRYDGQFKRHRFFSIVDRSVLDAWMGDNNVFNIQVLLSNPTLDPRRQQHVNFGTMPIGVAAGLRIVPDTAPPGAPVILPYIQPGSVLIINAGRPNQSTATVTRVNRTAAPGPGTPPGLPIMPAQSFEAVFANAAPAGSPIGIPNLPPLVQHSSIIE